MNLGGQSAKELRRGRRRRVLAALGELQRVRYLVDVEVGGVTLTRRTGRLFQ